MSLIGIALPSTQCLYMYISYMSSFGKSSCPDSEAMHVKLLVWETSSGNERGQQFVEGLPCHLAGDEMWARTRSLIAK